MAWTVIGPRPARAWFVAFALTAACGEDSPSPEKGEQSSEEEPASSEADAGKAAGKDAAVKDAAPQAANDSGAAPSQDAKVDAGQPAGGSSSGLPCDVAAALEKHCGSCHGAKPASPAQPTLVTFAGITADSPTKKGNKVYERVLARLADPQSPMPPLNVAPDGIPAADKTLIEDWIKAGRQQSIAVCESGTKNSPPKQEPPPDLSQCDYQLEFRAHNGTSADDTVGFQPPLVDDQYECFNFGVPWNEKVQGIRFDPIIDDQRVVHHWILYSITEAREPGSHGCGGANRTFVNGWAPGGPPSVFEGDIGLQMPTKGQTFQLEVHYNNPTRLTDVADRSGVKVCATKTLRKNEAATFWLGSVFINLPPGQESKVTDTCTVPSPGKGPVTILSTSPHMHQLGTYMKTTVKRAADGKVEMLTDKPFDFRDQAHYASGVVIQPGDQLTTTCTYKNTSTRTVSFGEGTGDEMCFNFVTAYPVEGLGAGNRCMGLNPFAGALDGLFGGP
jgi:Copper type II ascorbate-dependent monooxygenase, C-terminal domain/Copper type II ascorbate-dependent monooxygenase, N-terminal domain